MPVLEPPIRRTLNGYDIEVAADGSSLWVKPPDHEGMRHYRKSSFDIVTRAGYSITWREEEVFFRVGEDVISALLFCWRDNPHKGEEDDEDTDGCARCLVDLAGQTTRIICGTGFCASCAKRFDQWARKKAKEEAPAPAADKYNFPSWFFGGLAFGPVPGDTRYIYANGRVFSFTSGQPVSASAIWREPLIGVKCHHCRGIFGTSFHLEDGVVSCSRCARDNTGEPLRVGDFSEKWAAAAGVKDKATVSLEAISKLYQDPWKDDPRYGLHEASSLPQATSEMHGNGVIWNKQRSGLDKRSYKHPRTKREVPMPLDLEPPGGW